MRSIGLFASCTFTCLLAAGTPGSLRFGTVPSGSGARPVLLFVHGWNSDSSTWSGSNDMESRAAGAGYRTAFLDVYPDQSMWTNAPLVRSAVDQVQAHFPGAAVVLVCHSKGGVDGHTAIAYSGADAKLSRFITLGTPHYGTPLADLAWSTWAGWLASLLGSRNEGNRVLQTGYMASFRAQTDARPQARAVPIATAGGTKAGPLFSAYWFGGVAIGRTSDGVVPLDSTSLPYQRTRLFTRFWNHAEVKQGSNAWPYLGSYLGTAPLAAAAIPPAAAAEPTPLVLDRLYRGGQTRSGMAEFSFPVDPGQTQLQVLLQTSQAPREALLVSPSGRSYRLHPRAPFRSVPWHSRIAEEAEAEAGAFPGAVSLHAELSDPETGPWRVVLAAQGEDAYFFTAVFPGDAGRSIQPALLREGLQGRPLALAAEGGSEPRLERFSSRSTTPLLARRPDFQEPVVANHTLVFTWPGGRERCLILSEAEAPLP